MATLAKKLDNPFTKQLEKTATEIVKLEKERDAIEHRKNEALRGMKDPAAIRQLTEHYREATEDLGVLRDQMVILQREEELTEASNERKAKVGARLEREHAKAVKELKAAMAKAVEVNATVLKIQDEYKQTFEGKTWLYPCDFDREELNGTRQYSKYSIWLSELDREGY